jgi:hypothetical protein
MANNAGKGKSTLILDITATFKEFFQKNHGQEAKNWNSSNFTAK